jgi:hypothetical protein
MPLGSEYVEALQNPRLALSDAELQNGRVETDRLGLPKPRSGNFAVVFKVTCGSKKYALRCFLKESADRQERYSIISASLAETHLPCMVDFEYLPTGIRIQQRRHPVLKMEWVDGVALDKYVGDHLHEPRLLLDLASRFLTLVMQLRSSEVEHGNIMVENDGGLRLVDYDGMFVPRLAGKKSPEAGHPNYQHPARDGTVYGPSMDNFSAWVIYLSLVILAYEPYLWGIYDGGDDKLLFGRQDFLNPSVSSCFSTLRGCSPEARSLTKRLTDLLSQDLTKIPPLAEVREVASFQTLATESTDTAWLPAPLSTPVGLPVWMTSAPALPFETTEQSTSPVSASSSRAPAFDCQCRFVIDPLLPVSN